MENQFILFSSLVRVRTDSVPKVRSVLALSFPGLQPLAFVPFSNASVFISVRTDVPEPATVTETPSVQLKKLENDVNLKKYVSLPAS